ncbi:hypothetical protein MPER_06277, partial [Moniliophthora perniciosa FA553]
VPLSILFAATSVGLDYYCNTEKTTLDFDFHHQFIQRRRQAVPELRLSTPFPSLPFSTMRGIKLSPFLLFFSHLLIPTHAQGNGTSKCADSGSDWYTNAVGETPCNTYERLRKLCNSNYRVGTLTTNTPPDYCDDQVDAKSVQAQAGAESMR